MGRKRFTCRDGSMVQRRLGAGVWALALAVGVVACGGRESSRRADSASSTAVTGTDGVQEALSWRLEAPQSWDDRVRLIDGAEGVGRPIGEGVRAARRFEYVPHDTTLMPQPLLGIYVYDSTAWAQLEAEEGPRFGELITRGAGVVFVGTLPPSNPYAPGSEDAAGFGGRTVTMEYVRRAFHVVR